MKKGIREEKGITLLALVIAITVLIILTDIVVYNIKDHFELVNLEEMQSDIENLSGRISTFYAENGQIPAKLKYTNLAGIKDAGLIDEKVDPIDSFYVIDLSAIEILTLNRGEDFEKIKNKTTLTEEDFKLTDLYIINEVSHHIFYVAGIKMHDEIYYTNYTKDNKDTSSVDLKYVEGVKIPDGFHYASGTKELGILITNEEKTETYKWVPVEQKITQISDLPDDIEIEKRKTEDFIKSVNAYQGYYQKQNDDSSQVIYLEVTNDWDNIPAYDQGGWYQDENGDSAYIPEGFKVSKIPGENTIDQGLVVADENNNEWVWIEVPKSIYTNVKSSDDYENIEKDMQTYANSYRSRNKTYKDTWYSEQQYGLKSSEEYNTLKNSMLKSVYEKGGFYIGRYETGTDLPRKPETTNPTEAVIRQDAYPYNFVTCNQAQSKAKELGSISSESTGSLMFGIQWDLVLKFIETKQARTEDEIKNSIDWGNYVDINFTVIRGKYSPNRQGIFSDVPENGYEKKSGTTIFFTTGATNRNTALNIYDFAGNFWELTLEYSNTPEKPCCVRGGYASNNGKACPASSYTNTETNNPNVATGFRVSLW